MSNATQVNLTVIDPFNVVVNEKNTKEDIERIEKSLIHNVQAIASSSSSNFGFESILVASPHGSGDKKVGCAWFIGDPKDYLVNLSLSCILKDLDGNKVQCDSNVTTEAIHAKHISLGSKEHMINNFADKLWNEHWEAMKEKDQNPIDSEVLSVASIQNDPSTMNNLNGFDEVKVKLTLRDTDLTIIRNFTFDPRSQDQSGVINAYMHALHEALRVHVLETNNGTSPNLSGLDIQDFSCDVILKNKEQSLKH